MRLRRGLATERAGVESLRGDGRSFFGGEKDSDSAEVSRPVPRVIGHTAKGWGCAAILKTSRTGMDGGEECGDGRTDRTGTYIGDVYVRWPHLQPHTNAHAEPDNSVVHPSTVFIHNQQPSLIEPGQRMAVPLSTLGLGSLSSGPWSARIADLVQSHLSTCPLMPDLPFPHLNQRFN